jgi:uncharacterized membrane protein
LNANVERPVVRSRWFSPHSIWRSIVIRPRLYIAVAGAIATLLLLPPVVQGPVREATAWCIGGGLYLFLAFGVMLRCPPARIKTRAALQDDSGTVILVLIVAAVLSSFMAIIGLMSESKGASDMTKHFYILLAASTIFISWMVMQVVFTLHYAHEHYAPHNLAKDNPGGLDFPKDVHPDYWDFFYFATSIGATSQTSDVSIISKGLRRLVTLHAIVSFFFNTMVLALTINLAASMM